MSQPALDLPQADVPGRRAPHLPPRERMLDALMTRDARLDGVVFAGVTSTGIFCRPSCPARKPRPEHVRFFGSAREALAAGFRPCLRCRPLEPVGDTPPEVRALLDALEEDPTHRFKDADLSDRGLDPAWLRRWFKRHHGMTFHAYQRARRLTKAIHALQDGAPVAHAAFDHGYESLSGFQDALKRITGRSPGRSRGVRLVHLATVQTPLGPVVLGASDEGVCLLEFTDRPMLETQLSRLARRMHCSFVPGRTELTERLEAELTAYFAGVLRTFETPLQTSGTDFQERVWEGLRSIPYGETRSYAQQAERIGAPAAVRAVARANGDNRIAIVIPCHRVIGADGGLVGYGGGLWRKRYLLELEGRVGAAAG